MSYLKADGSVDLKQVKWADCSQLFWLGIDELQRMRDWLDAATDAASDAWKVAKAAAQQQVRTGYSYDMGDHADHQRQADRAELRIIVAGREREKAAKLAKELKAKSDELLEAYQRIEGILDWKKSSIARLRATAESDKD